MTGLELTIFLSGTMQDLCKEREAIRAQIGPPLYRIVAAEDWGTRYCPPRDLCARSVRESDIYLGLFGGRYGWIPPDEVVSVTEWEFDAARQAGKPALIYIRRGRKGPRQGAFLASVSDFDVGHNTRSEFESLDQLVAWVREDLITLMEDLAGESEGSVPTAHDPLLYVKCRLNLALRAKDAGEWAQAVRHYQWVLNRGVWNLGAREFALRGLQSLYVAEGLLDKATEAARARVELTKELTNEQRTPSGHIASCDVDGSERSCSMELAGLYVEWARVDTAAGRWQESADHLDHALEIYRELGEWTAEEATQGSLAEVYEAWARSCQDVPERAEYVEAAHAYRNAIEIYEKLRDRDKLALVWHQLALVHLRHGRDFEALSCLNRSLGYQFENDTPRTTIGEIIANLQAVVEIQCRHGNSRQAVKVLLRQFEALLWAGQHLQAAMVAESAAELCREDDVPRLLDSLRTLGNTYETDDEPERAASLKNALVAYQQALGLATRFGIHTEVDRLRASAERVSASLLD